MFAHVGDAGADEDFCVGWRETRSMTVTEPSEAGDIGMDVETGAEEGWAMLAEKDDDEGDEEDGRRK